LEASKKAIYYYDGVINFDFFEIVTHEPENKLEWMEIPY